MSSLARIEKYTKNNCVAIEFRRAERVGRDRRSFCRRSPLAILGVEFFNFRSFFAYDYILVRSILSCVNFLIGGVDAFVLIVPFEWLRLARISVFRVMQW